VSAAQTVLAVLGGLFGIAVIAGALYAYAKGGAQDARIERLQGERDDYLSRLNYIEPRFKSAQEQNEILRTLVDPSARLIEIRDTVDTKTAEILAAVQRTDRNVDAIKGVLLAQARTFDEIKQRVHVDRKDEA
jgi:hypothetical protein